MHLQNKLNNSVKEMEESVECLSLSQKEINRSLSSRKKKRKTFKPMLLSPFPPEFKKVREGTDELNEILERSLAIARLYPPTENCVLNPKEVRKCLALGVNAVYRHLHKSNIEAVLLASDINPESLVTHVISKCHNDSIPLLRLPQLRSITKKSLGFEGIAIGFHKNSNIFQNILDCMKKQCNHTINNNTSVISIKETVIIKTKVSEIIKPRKFDLLKRSEKNVRVFVPEKFHMGPKPALVSGTDFISLSSQNFELDQSLASGVSTNLKRPHPTVSENEVTQKKKKKKGAEGLIDNSPYLTANVAKIVSNPERREKPKKGKTSKK